MDSTRSPASSKAISATRSFIPDKSGTATICGPRLRQTLITRFLRTLRPGSWSCRAIKPSGVSGADPFAPAQHQSRLLQSAPGFVHAQAHHIGHDHFGRENVRRQLFDDPHQQPQQKEAPIAAIRRRREGGLFLRPLLPEDPASLAEEPARGRPELLLRSSHCARARLRRPL